MLSGLGRAAGQEAHRYLAAGWSGPDLWSGSLGPERLTCPAHWCCAQVQFSFLVACKMGGDGG